MLRRCLYVFLLPSLLLASSTSCVGAQNKSMPLAEFTENYVDVAIFLDRDRDGNFTLSATFTPPDGYHVYSKDIPTTGVDGLGRPTLIELPVDHDMKALGPLRESVNAQIPDFGPRELLVYPAGPVTLSLPVEIPPGDGWVEGEIEVTYMACSASQCKPPVVAKRVLVPVPRENVFAEP